MSPSPSKRKADCQSMARVAKCCPSTGHPQSQAASPHSRAPPPRPPPPRPPRPKTSLPNLRPTIILSPLAVDRCAYRLPSPLPDTASRDISFTNDVLAALPTHLAVVSPPPQSPTTHGPRMVTFPPDSSHMPTTSHALEPLRWSDDASDWSAASAKPRPSSSTAHSEWPSATEWPAKHTGDPANELPAAREHSSTHRAALRWRTWLFNHRRVCWMCATILVVILAATAITGGVLWRLTLTKSALAA